MTTYYAEGVYNARILKQRLDRTRSTDPKKDNVPMFVLTVMPDGGAYDREITWIINEKTADFVVQKLRRIGFAGSSFSELDPSSDKFYDLSGQTIEAECRYEGNYERWDLPRPAQRERVELPAVERQTITQRLDAMFGRRLKDTAPSKPLDTPPEPSQPPLQGTPRKAVESIQSDDQVPF